MAAQHILVVDDDAGFAEATGAVLAKQAFASPQHRILARP